MPENSKLRSLLVLQDNLSARLPCESIYRASAGDRQQCTNHNGSGRTLRCMFSMAVRPTAFCPLRCTHSTVIARLLY